MLQECWWNASFISTEQYPVTHASSSFFFFFPQNKCNILKYVQLWGWALQCCLHTSCSLTHSRHAGVGGTTSPRHLLFLFTSHSGHFTNLIQIQTNGDLHKCVFLFANSHVRYLSWKGIPKIYFIYWLKHQLSPTRAKNSGGKWCRYQGSHFHCWTCLWMDKTSFDYYYFLLSTAKIAVTVKLLVKKKIPES